MNWLRGILRENRDLLDELTREILQEKNGTTGTGE